MPTCNVIDMFIWNLFGDGNSTCSSTYNDQCNCECQLEVPFQMQGRSIMDISNAHIAIQLRTTVWHAISNANTATELKGLLTCQLELQFNTQLAMPRGLVCWYTYVTSDWTSNFGACWNAIGIFKFGCSSKCNCNCDLHCQFEALLEMTVELLKRNAIRDATWPWIPNANGRWNLMRLSNCRVKCQADSVVGSRFGASLSNSHKK